MDTRAAAKGTKRIARRVPAEVVSEGNPELVEERYADDAIEHDPFGDHVRVAAIRESFEAVIPASPDRTATGRGHHRRGVDGGDAWPASGHP